MSSTREVQGGKCQMEDNSEGIWENKLHRKLILTGRVFLKKSRFLPSRSFPEWDVIERLA